MIDIVIIRSRDRPKESHAKVRDPPPPLPSRLNDFCRARAEGENRKRLLRTLSKRWGVICDEFTRVFDLYYAEKLSRRSQWYDCS